MMTYNLSKLIFSIVDGKTNFTLWHSIMMDLLVFQEFDKVFEENLLEQIRR